MRQMRRSILMLPLLVLLAFIVVAGVSLVYTDWVGRETLLDSTRKHVLEDAAIFARFAEYRAIDRGGQLEQEIMLHGAEENVAMTALIDPSGRIIFAQRSEWKGHPAAKMLPHWDAERFSRVTQGIAADVQVDSSGLRISVLMPYAEAPAQGELVSTRRGVVYLEYDAASALIKARHDNLRQRLPDLGLVLFFALMMAFWLQRSVARPLRSIANVSRRIGMGDLSVRAPVEGIDEVAELGAHFNSMADFFERNLERQRLNARVFETVGEAIVVADFIGNIVTVNPAFSRLTGFSEAEVIGQNLRMLNSGRHDMDAHLEIMKSLREKGTWSGEIWTRRKNGELFLNWHTVSTVCDEKKEISHYVSVLLDLSEIRRAQHQAEQLSWHDPLTGLANRALFLQQLEQTLDGAGREGGFAVVLLLDLDRFKDANEARGLAYGDALLRAVAERLKHILHPDDVLARLNADEFAILLPRLAVTSEAAGIEAMSVAVKLSGVLRDNIEIDGEMNSLDASIGIALFPNTPDETASDVLRHADVAMHRAKQEGGGHSVFFETTMGDIVQERFRLERELRQAVAENQLRIYLQPQVNAAGLVVGSEALVRWQHPERGLVPPIMFIPLAEASDLIVAIDRWMMAEVCRLLTRLERDGCAMRLSVNVSPRHFRKDDFVVEVKRLISASGANPAKLMIEVTEGLVINDYSDVVAKMTALKELGVRFSMDDFGTGYSSLAYLKRLPIYELKIDRSFIQDVTTDANDAALVETILAVAQHLHLQVVAEGVETQAQADFLKARADIIHQGYLYGRPEPAVALLERLSGNNFYLA